MINLDDRDIGGEKAMGKAGAMVGCIFSNVHRVNKSGVGLRGQGSDIDRRNVSSGGEDGATLRCEGRPDAVIVTRT